MLVSLTRKAGLALTLTLLLIGCATVNHIDFPSNSSSKGKRVTASLTHFNVFFLIPPSDLDKLVRDLGEQCPNGKVEGITMVDTRRYFYIFGVLMSVAAAGQCVE